jgi:hypothetical protein
MNVRRDRRLALSAAVLVGVLCGARMWLLQGLLTNVRIDGGSMAEALPGQRAELTCPECGRNWQADVEQLHAISQVICPQCGRIVDLNAAVREYEATRVVIDRGAYVFGSPRRFDIVAFHQPDSAELAVKRIVALPDEHWEIRKGELLINGRLVRKTYSQFQEMATLVSTSCDHWHSGQDSPWKRSAGGWSWQGSCSQPDWLEYRHVSAHPAARGRESPVQDYDPYNPALARELNEVVDLMVQCELSAIEARVHCRIHDGREWLSGELDFSSGRVVARRGTRELGRAVIPKSGSASLAWGLCDRQFWLLRNGQMVFRHELDEPTSPGQLLPNALSLGISGTGNCTLMNLQVVRDVYYLDSQGLGGHWQAAPLAADEYGVLGDNAPLSVDSRQWQRGVKRTDILGKVFAR